MHAKEKVSVAITKHTGGGGGGEDCEQSLPFCTGIQFSGDSIHMINDQIKKEGWKQSIKGIFKWNNTETQSFFLVSFRLKSNKAWTRPKQVSFRGLIQTSQKATQTFPCRSPPPPTPSWALHLNVNIPLTQWWYELVHRGWCMALPRTHCKPTTKGKKGVSFVFTLYEN